MFQELNNYLNSPLNDDYWYDELVIICNDILLDFSTSEWESLLDILPTKSYQWQKKLCEALAGIDSQFSVRCILKIASSCDTNLFVTCMDTLRDLDTGSISEKQKQFLVDRIEREISQLQGIDEIVLKNVLEKIGGI